MFIAGINPAARTLLSASDAAAKRTDLDLGDAATHAAADFDSAGSAAAITLAGLGAGSAATHDAADFDAAGAAAAITLAGLGAGSAATHDAADFDAAGAAAAITLSGLGAGTAAVENVDTGTGIPSLSFLGHILTDVPINIVGTVDATNLVPSLADLPDVLAGAIYDNGAGTLTAPTNGAGPLPLGTKVLLGFTQDDLPCAGYYVVTHEGDGGSPCVLTRDASMSSSGDFVNGKAWNVAFGQAPMVLHVAGGFTLGSSNVELIELSVNGYWERGFNNLTAGAAEGQTFIAAGPGGRGMKPVSADVATVLKAANAAAILAALSLPTPPSVARVTADHTAVAGEIVFVNASGGAVTVTLPASPTAGNTVRVKRVDGGLANAVTSSSGGNDLDAGSSTTLGAQWDSLDFVYDGAGMWGVF